MAAVHGLMSFHEPSSDVSRLNREASSRAVRVDARTLRVIRLALEFSAASGGCFDVTVAPRLVQWGFLPSPLTRDGGKLQDHPESPDPRASWRDIEVRADGAIRFHRPLWIDLGGIAKGFAVDEAIAGMALGPDVPTYVNAGGDLRTQGPEPRIIRLAATGSPEGSIPVVRLADGSLASSGGPAAVRRQGNRHVRPYVDGRRQTATGRQRFVSVLAAQCVVADALTKIVMARGARAADLLGRFRATALIHDSGRGWRRVGMAA